MNLRRLVFLSFVFAFLCGGAAITSAGDVNNKIIFGLHEKANLPELNLKLEAKLDTGAVSASLSATDIESFTKDGDDWVRFKSGVEGKKNKTYELPVEKTVKIRRRKSDIDDDDKTYTRRYVVMLEVCVGDHQVPMRVNLADRTNFNYPLLIGSEGLKDLGAIVDSSQEFSAGKPKKCTDKKLDN